MTRSGMIYTYANKGDLTQGSISRHLLRLSIPMIWGILAMISFQLVDTFYISLLGTAPLAAITFTFPVTYAVFSLVLGLSIAMSSVVSRQIGEGNAENVRRITTHGLMLALACGIFLAGLGVLLIQPVFAAMGANEAMMPMIRDYMLIWFGGSMFLALPMVGNAAIRAGGDSFLPALIMTVAAVINIALDPVLIFGLFGFPRLELQGAALATVFSNGCAMAASLYVLYVHKKMISRDFLSLRHFGDSLRRLAYIALPAGLTGLIQPVTSAVIIALLAGYGAETVAAFGVATRMEAFAFTIIMALASGMAPIIGQNWGAGLSQRVQETLNKALIFAVLWSLLVGIVFILFAKPLAGLFAEDKSPAFIRVVVLYFWIVGLTYAPGNLVPGWGSAFNAMGMPARSFLMILVKLVIVQVPLAVLGGILLGVPGIFAAIAVTNIVTGIGFHIWNMRSCRKSRAAANPA